MHDFVLWGAPRICGGHVSPHPSCSYAPGPHGGNILVSSTSSSLPPPTRLKPTHEDLISNLQMDILPSIWFFSGSIISLYSYLKILKSRLMSYLPYVHPSLNINIAFSRLTTINVQSLLTELFLFLVSCIGFLTIISLHILFILFSSCIIIQAVPVPSLAPRSLLPTQPPTRPPFSNPLPSPNNYDLVFPQILCVRDRDISRQISDLAGWVYGPPPACTHNEVPDKEIKLDRSVS